MKGGATISLSLALAFGAFVCPHAARAVSTHANAGTNAATARISARQEAAEMVPATADLKNEIDARKLQPGDRFQAVLQQDVQLKNGPKLDHGTILMGTVTADTTHPDRVRLALRFTRAELKNGQTIPIKATVVELAQPRSYPGSGTNLADQTGLWSPHTLRVDQLGAISGVDMHSAIASRNSTVLISNKRDDVKLVAGSQLELAIAARNNTVRKGA